MSLTPRTLTGPLPGVTGGTMHARLTATLHNPAGVLAGADLGPQVDAAIGSGGTFSLALYANDDAASATLGTAWRIWGELVTATGLFQYAPELIQLLISDPSSVALGSKTPAQSSPAYYSYALASALTAEAATRAADDATNAGAIADEATTRAGNDNDLADLISAEAVTRAAHSALTTGAHGGIVSNTDLRLTDARTPTIHHTTHNTGGTDPIAASDIGAAAVSHSHNLPSNVAYKDTDNAFSVGQGFGAAFNSSAAARASFPWLSGDTHPAVYAGSTNGSNAQSGLWGQSGSGYGVNGEAINGVGVQAYSSSGAAFGSTGERVQLSTQCNDGANTTAAGKGVWYSLIYNATNAARVLWGLITVGHASTPTDGFGVRLGIRLQDSTTAAQDASDEATYWSTATHATRSSRWSVATVQNAGALAERIAADGGNGAATTGLWLWDVDTGALQRVTVGIANSGGIGYKVLCIPN